MAFGTVVLVDDEAVLTRVVSEVLESYGLEVHSASDSTEALGLLHKVKPDLLITDIMMPEVDGLMLVRLLRSDPEWASLPVLVVSALASPSDKSDAGTAGASAFLQKPFTKDELRAAVEAFIPLAQPTA